jgi:DNA-binding Lrp family transcriptional regulator
MRIMDNISAISYVSAVHRTEGRYELIIKIDAESEESLKEIISTNINKIPGVDATISLPIAKDHLRS